MSEFPDDIKKDAEEAVAGFVGWIEGGNTTASLSEHAVAGLKHSFASAILAERERCEKIASNEADRICDNGNDYSGPRVYDMIVTARRIQFAISGEPNIHLSDDVRARITKTSEDAA